jgi:hypothetical protein
MARPSPAAVWHRHPASGLAVFALTGKFERRCSPRIFGTRTNEEGGGRHASASEAIHGAATSKDGLLRRFAPRNDGQQRAPDTAVVPGASGTSVQPRRQLRVRPWPGNVMRKRDAADGATWEPEQRGRTRNCRFTAASRKSELAVTASESKEGPCKNTMAARKRSKCRALPLGATDWRRAHANLNFRDDCRCRWRGRVPCNGATAAGRT